MPRVIREQDSQLTNYEPIEVPSGMSIQDVFNEYRTRLNLKPEMLALINGEPRSKDTALQENDSLYWKEETKARGR